MSGRRTFLSQFIICLACMAGAFFAWERGILQAVYLGDMSMMTSVIGVLFVGTSIYLCWQAWHIEHADTADGYLAAELCLIIGVIGMALGLAAQGKAIAAGGQAVFAAWATQLSATITGCVACAIILLMTRNLERGIKTK